MQLKDMPQVSLACGDLLYLPCCREASGKHGQRYDNLVGQAKEQWKGQTASDLCECADARHCLTKLPGEPLCTLCHGLLCCCTSTLHAVLWQAEHSIQISNAPFTIQLIDADPNAHGQAKATSEGTDEKKRKM